MASDKACFVTKWCDVKPHGNVNLLDAHLLKPMYSCVLSSLLEMTLIRLEQFPQVHLWELLPQLLLNF